MLALVYVFVKITWNCTWIKYAKQNHPIVGEAFSELHNSTNLTIIYIYIYKAPHLYHWKLLSSLAQWVNLTHPHIQSSHLEHKLIITISHFFIVRQVSTFIIPLFHLVTKIPFHKQDNRGSERRVTCSMFLVGG